MIKRLVKFLLGFHAATLINLLQYGPLSFVQACLKAYDVTRGQLHDIPEITLGEILGDRRPQICMRSIRYEDGILPSEQIMVLLAVAVAEQPKEVLEIGTFMGHTTRALAENLPSATIHTIDLPESFTPEEDRVTDIPKDDLHLIRRRAVGQEYRGAPCEVHIRQHFGDTATWDFAQAGSPTFFFIDGSHTYEYCKSDSEKCFDLTDGPAVFLWHDCDKGHPGVAQFVMEWRRLGRDIRRIVGTPIAYWKRVGTPPRDLSLPSSGPGE